MKDWHEISLWALVVAAALAAVLIPLAAHAQMVAGGDPATALQAFVSWLQGPIGRPLVSLCLMLTAILLMVGRHSFEGLIFAGAGALFFFGAPAIANMFAGG